MFCWVRILSSLTRVTILFLFKNLLLSANTFLSGQLTTGQLSQEVDYDVNVFFWFLMSLHGENFTIVFSLLAI